jgi:hypothetical protein
MAGNGFGLAPGAGGSYEADQAQEARERASSHTARSVTPRSSPQARESANELINIGRNAAKSLQSQIDDTSGEGQF